MSQQVDQRLESVRLTHTGDRAPNEDPPHFGTQTVLSNDTTLLVEGIPEPSYAMWNLLARSHGALAAFTCDNMSLCHFPTPESARRFTVILDTMTDAPRTVVMFSQTRAAFDHLVQQIRQNPAMALFTYQYYSIRQVPRI